MNLRQKLEILGSSARFDVCAATSVGRHRRGAKGAGPAPGGMGTRLPAGCCHAYTADGRCIGLFKVLLTNGCGNDCYYCQNSTSCRARRQVTRFENGELARVFLEFYKRNYVEGLFLSSGFGGDPDVITWDFIAIIEALRKKHGFGGYIHAKVLPGTSLSAIRALAPLVDRLSLNLEAPGKGFLSELCSTKDYNKDLLTRLTWMHALDRRVGLPAGLTTQVIVGGSASTDHDILKATASGYRHLGLRRVYYSAFFPVKGSPLEHVEPAPLLREHRLYQADWLLRVYKYDARDVLPPEGCNLPLGVDPKIAIAINKGDEWFPVDVNEASFKELVRVPGIGPISARRIVAWRNAGNRIEREGTLRRLGAVVKRARPFITVGGRRFTSLDEWFRNNKLAPRDVEPVVAS